MFDVGDTLRDALDGARAQMHDAQRAIAKANSGETAGRSADGAMARTAESALFTEALLDAERARFAAIKTAVK